MTRRALLVATVVVGSLLGWSGPAAACSAGPFEPREVTQLLVFGRVRSLEVGPRGATGFHQAVVTLDVLRVHRGTAGRSLTYVDVSSVASDAGVVSYAGGSGACGTIDRDPVGQYVLIALARAEDGRWYANRLYGAIYTDEPDHAAYRWLLERHGVAVPFLVHGQLTEALARPVLVP
ncbi:MAG TPA: hypothetical protein VFM06_06080 [Candidatus Limnocylindria bacterium]|nr:hypothetical protein [Candidatus Limnocylindria bacterium]